MWRVEALVESANSPAAVPVGLDAIVDGACADGVEAEGGAHQTGSVPDPRWLGVGNKDFFKSSQIRVKSNNLKFLSSQIRVKSNSLKKLSSQICVKSNNQNFFSSQIWVKSNNLEKFSSQIRVKSNNSKFVSSQIRVKSNIFDLTPIFVLKNALSNNLPTPSAAWGFAFIITASQITIIRLFNSLPDFGILEVQGHSPQERIPEKSWGKLQWNLYTVNTRVHWWETIQHQPWIQPLNLNPNPNLSTSTPTPTSQPQPQPLTLTPTSQPQLQPKPLNLNPNLSTSTPP